MEIWNRDGLSHKDAGAPRLRWYYLPLPVGKGRWMGKVGRHPAVKQLEALSDLPFE